MALYTLAINNITALKQKRRPLGDITGCDSHVRITEILSVFNALIKIFDYYTNWFALSDCVR
jgi:hypothetical protein